tara:strand:- start:6196 stop:7353 length:1158 start_codon:yes stop_codon:yes gene_type:complete
MPNERLQTGDNGVLRRRTTGGDKHLASSCSDFTDDIIVIDDGTTDGGYSKPTECTADGCDDTYSIHNLGNGWAETANPGNPVLTGTSRSRSPMCSGEDNRACHYRIKLEDFEPIQDGTKFCDAIFQCDFGQSGAKYRCIDPGIGISWDVTPFWPTTDINHSFHWEGMPAAASRSGPMMECCSTIELLDSDESPLIDSADDSQHGSCGTHNWGDGDREWTLSMGIFNWNMGGSTITGGRNYGRWGQVPGAPRYEVPDGVKVYIFASLGYVRDWCQGASLDSGAIGQQTATQDTIIHSGAYFESRCHNTDPVQRISWFNEQRNWHWANVFSGVSTNFDCFGRNVIDNRLGEAGSPMEQEYFCKTKQINHVNFPLYSGGKVIIEAFDP